MSVDLTQFHQAFFDESLEHLATMESALLDLDPMVRDEEALNTIFRSAHSIKGAAGTLGFQPLVAFTHVAETLLDQMRARERQVDRQSIDVLLRSVDVLRGKVEALMAEEEADDEEGRVVLGELEALLGSAPQATAAAKEASEPQDDSIRTFRITCRPEAGILRLGNDMLGLFRVLADLGEVRARCDASGLPAFADLDPLDCRLNWELELRGPTDAAEIAEVFEWVEDECELRIEEVGAEETPEAASSEPVAPVPLPPPTREPRPVPRPGGSAPESAPSRKARKEQGSIRVALDKIDALVNLVGELVITQGMLGQTGRHMPPGPEVPHLLEGLDQLERNTRELQEAVMAIRMLPVSFAFSRLPRMVRDVCDKLEKRVDLRVEGESTEVDKTVLEQIQDPLVHIVRNALDHGLEGPEERRAAGKDEAGCLRVAASHQGGKVVIEISDDGRGIRLEKVLEKARARGLVPEGEQPTPAQIRDLLFHPGFSTADAVSDLSGRGVGLDVVRRNIKDLGGEVLVDSEEGRGSRFTIRLPLTMAILEGQLVRLGPETYIVPLVSVVETVPIDVSAIRPMPDGVRLYRSRRDYLPMIDLSRTLGTPRNARPLGESLLVIVEAEGQRAGLVVDDLDGQQQVVIKSLETNFMKLEGLAGATVLGNGSIGLILDVNELLRRRAEQDREASRKVAEGTAS